MQSIKGERKEGKKGLKYRCHGKFIISSSAQFSFNTVASTNTRSAANDAYILACNVHAMTSDYLTSA